MPGDIAQRVLRTIQRYRMFAAGDAVGVAVSGGADSVGLLRLLVQMRDELGIPDQPISVHTEEIAARLDGLIDRLRTVLGGRAN